MVQAGEPGAAACAGLQEATVKASLHVEQLLPLLCQTLRWILQSMRQPIEVLAALVLVLSDLAA